MSDVLGHRVVPYGERALAAVADGGREDRITLDRELDGRILLAGREERDEEGPVERDVRVGERGCASR